MYRDPGLNSPESRIASFRNLSPLYTTIPKNVISFSEISAVNFIVG